MPDINKKQKIVIWGLSAILFLGFIMVAIDIKNKIGLQENDRVEKKSVEKEQQNDGVDWNHYRDKKNGFEIDYPKKYIGKEITEEQRSFDCGERIAPSFGIFKNDKATEPLYIVSVYSNPQGLQQKDYFFCKEKLVSDYGATSDSVNSINAFKIGDKVDAVSVVLIDGSESVMVSSGGNIIEIKNQNKEDNDTEFQSIINTFEIIDAMLEDVPESAVAGLKDFCANELGDRAVLKYHTDVKINKNAESETFIVCSADNLFDSKTEAYHLKEEITGKYSILWRETISSGNNAIDQPIGRVTPPKKLDWNYYEMPKSVGDINEDGLDEIFVVGSISALQNSHCIVGCTDWCLYVPLQFELKCASLCQGWGDSGRIAQEIAGKDCKSLPTSPPEGLSCAGDPYNLLCYDRDAKDGKIKDYLLKKVAEMVDAR